MGKADVSLIQKSKTACRVIKGEAVVIDLDTNMLYSLNPVASVIWEMCSEKATMAEIVDKVTEEFEVERAVAEEDCLEFISSFVDKGLLIAEGNLR